MSQNRPQIITRKQAKKQINTFGISLVIYIVLNILLWYGTPLLEAYFPQILLGFDHELVMLVFTAVMMLFMVNVPFRLTSSALHLNIREYLNDPHLSLARQLSLCSMGAALYIAVTGLSSYLHLILHIRTPFYSFYGDFSTRYSILMNILCFIVIAVIKPWCDEYIFRGIIQRQLGHYGRYFGVFASSFLYAIAQTSFNEAIPAFFLGWYLAILTLRYHSIKPARRVHIFVSVIYWIVSVLPDRLVLIPTILIVALYIFAAFSLIQRIISLKVITHFEWDSRLWKIMLTSWSMILCMILFVSSVVLSFIL